MEMRKVTEATADDRGKISDIFYKEKIDHVAIIESYQGGLIRGNHYHKKTTQHIFMTKGSLRYWYRPVDEDIAPSSIVARPYDLITTPPFEVHALEILEYCEFIVFSEGMRGGKDYESDTFREITILTRDMLEGQS